MKNRFALGHTGINTANLEETEQLAKLSSLLFDLEPRRDQKSEFVGPYFGCTKQSFLGSKGHVAMHTENLQSTMEEPKEKGFSFRTKTAACFGGDNIKNVYLDGEYGGFAIHIMQK